MGAAFSEYLSRASVTLIAESDVFNVAQLANEADDSDVPMRHSPSVIVVALAAGGCATERQTQTAIGAGEGAATGAVVGTAVGGGGKGTVVGALVSAGAAAGYNW